MNHFRRIIKFGFPYLIRYWKRLALGVVFGMLYAASNAGFIGGTNLVASRMDPDAYSSVQKVVDSQSEAEVQVAIDSLADKRTVISIAHRLSTLSCMDRIIVFSGGRIVEAGGFQELLKLGGIFAKMAARQGIRPE